MLSFVLFLRQQTPKSRWQWSAWGNVNEYTRLNRLDGWCLRCVLTLYRNNGRRNACFLSQCTVLIRTHVTLFDAPDYCGGVRWGSVLLFSLRMTCCITIQVIAAHYCREYADASGIVDFYWFSSSWLLRSDFSVWLIHGRSSGTSGPFIIYIGKFVNTSCYPF